MHKPSMPKRTRAHDLSHGLDLAFGGTAVTAFAGILATGILSAHGAGTGIALAIACIAILICGIIGLSAKGAAELVHRGAIARIYAQALQGFRDPALDRRRSLQPPARERLGQRLADLGAGLVASLRLRVIDRDELASWAIDMRDQIALRRAAAAQIEAALTTDTQIITTATTAVRMEDAALGTQIDAAKIATESAADALFHLAQTMSLAADIPAPVQAALANLKYRLTEAQHHIRAVVPPDSGRLGSSSDARRAVERLPGYSEAMGQIMRGLPELAALE